MRLAIHLLPLPPQGPPNSLFPASSSLEPQHKFLHIAPDGSTLGELFSELEEKCKINYLHEFEYSKFAIKKLQDKDGNDLPVEYTLKDLFSGDTQPITLKVVQARPDRESSVPVTSSLRPTASHQAQRFPQQLPNHNNKINKINKKSALQAYANVNADVPIRSSESSPNHNGLQASEQASAALRQDTSLSQQRGKHRDSLTQQLTSPRPRESAERFVIDGHLVSSKENAFHFAKPTIPAIKTRISHPKNGATLDEPNTSKSENISKGSGKTQQPMNTRWQSISSPPPATFNPTGDTAEIDLGDETRHTHDIDHYGTTSQSNLSHGLISLEGQPIPSSPPYQEIEGFSSPPGCAPQIVANRRTSSGSNMSAHTRPMLPADVLESLRRRRRANGDDSDLEFPPQVKLPKRPSTKLSGSTSTPGDNDSNRKTSDIRDSATCQEVLHSVQTTKFSNTQSMTRAHSLTGAKPVTPKLSSARKSVSAANTQEASTGSVNNPSELVILQNRSPSNVKTSNSRAISTGNSKETPAKRLNQGRTISKPTTPATNDAQIKTPSTKQPVSRTLKHTPLGKGATETKPSSANKRKTAGKNSQSAEETGLDAEAQTQRKIEAERRAEAAEARKAELRGDYERLKERRIQEEGAQGRAVAALGYFNANDAARSTPKSSGIVEVSSQAITISDSPTPYPRQATGYLKKPSPASKGRKPSASEETTTIVPASSASSQHVMHASLSAPKLQTNEISGTMTKKVATLPLPHTDNKRKRLSTTNSEAANYKRPKLGASPSHKERPVRTLSTTSSQDRLLQMEIDFPKMNRVTETPSASPMELPRLPDTQNTETTRAVADTLKFLETSDAFEDDIDNSTQTVRQPTITHVNALVVDGNASDLVNGNRSDSIEPVEEPQGIVQAQIESAPDVPVEVEDPMEVDSASSSDDDDNHESVQETNNRYSIDSERAPARLITSSPLLGSSSSDEEPIEVTEPLPNSFSFPSSQPRPSSAFSVTASPEFLAKEPAERRESSTSSSSSSRSTTRSITAVSVPGDVQQSRKSSASPASSLPPTALDTLGSASIQLSKKRPSPSVAAPSLAAPRTIYEVPKPMPNQMAATQAPQPHLKSAAEESSSSSSSDESSSSDDESDSEDGTAAAAAPSSANGNAKGKLHKLAKFVRKLDRNPEEQKKRFSRALTFGSVRPD